MAGMAVAALLLFIDGVRDALGVNGLALIWIVLSVFTGLILILGRFRRFWSSGASLKNSETRSVFWGTAIIAVGVTAGLGALAWVNFPREQTAQDRLHEFHSDCLAQLRRTQPRDESGYREYANYSGAWITATRFFIANNLRPSAIATLEKTITSRRLPYAGASPLRGAFPVASEFQKLQLLIGVRCDNVQELIRDYSIYRLDY
jgi:hypothetical protein